MLNDMSNEQKNEWCAGNGNEWQLSMSPHSGNAVSGIDEVATGERAQIHSVVQCGGRTL